MIHKSCVDKFIKIKYPFCKKCGKQLKNNDELLCDDCKNKIHYFNRGWSLWIYDKEVKHSILEYKFNNRREYAKFYGYALYKMYFNLLLDLDIDAIVSVPLHKKRIKQRGYDQNYLIAKYFTKYLNNQNINIPIRKDLVIRSKYTNALKFQNPEDRILNMMDSFDICKDIKNIPKNVLIIDDIYTTGATIDSLSFKLKKIGINNIYFICLGSPVA